MRRRNVFGLVVAGVALCVVVPLLRADGSDPVATPTTGKPESQAKGAGPAAAPVAGNAKSAKRLAGFTEEREAAALTFVRANHPELAALLEQLKLSDNTEYQRAIRELFHSSEKLAQLQERNPRRYPIELEAWKLSSRIQLLVARLSMSPDPKVEDELRLALVEQRKLRKSQLTEDRERLESRLVELKEQLEQLDQNQDQYIEQRLAKLLNEASKSRSELNAARSGGSKKKKSEEK